jgi:hypothetical protein
VKVSFEFEKKWANGHVIRGVGKPTSRDIVDLELFVVCLYEVLEFEEMIKEQ